MSFRPIFGIPRLTQDWGTEQHERETHWTSLFYDLMIVAALNAIAEPFEELEEGEEEGESPPSLTPIKYLWLNALLQFVSVVNPWNALNEFTSLFEDESFIGHISFFIHCFGLAATTAGCVGELSENYKVLATGIILAKFGLLVLYVRPILYVQRARARSIVRCGSFVVNMLMMAWGMTFVGEDAFERFRMVLIAATIWDWASILIMGCLPQAHRVPLHIQSFADRIKEVTMVIFGEAIFAIILQPYSDATPQTHFYLALGTTLWLIYAMALQEFHILPSEEDHALRRSILFGWLWYYTQFFKQICLLGASIGIKRAHLLMFVAPTEPIDTDTRNLIVWGLSWTMFAVIMIRSYSFGFGRHPSKEDPFELYWLKVIWWVILGFACVFPQIVDWTILQAYPEPLIVLSSFGGMMIVIILFEAAMSNIVAMQMKKLIMSEGGGGGGGDLSGGSSGHHSHHHGSGEAGELTYLTRSHHHHSSTDVTGSNHHHEAPPAAFLSAHAPKTEETQA